MASSQQAMRGIELHQQTRAGDDNQQQPSDYYYSSDANNARSSHGIEPVPEPIGQAISDDHGKLTSEDVGKSPSTTIFSTVPSWPFQEDHQPNPANNRPNVKGPRQQSHLRRVLGHWWLEILTLFVAVALLVAIIVLLSLYNGKHMPEWPFSINLNTVIALLSTFLRAAMLAAVAEIIGQVKWTWFTERTRPLHHLQDFDSASRSMLGSLRLLAIVLWNFGWTSAGFLGMAAALITVTSLAVGPFTQQALKTAMCPRLVLNETAAVPAANYVPGSSSYYRIGAGEFEVEVDMKSAMIEGLTNPNGKDNNVEATCASSNCTWEDYGTHVTHASIGLCSACIDTTDYVSGPDDGGNITLPDYEAFINYNRGQYMWMGSSNLTWASDSFSEEFATASSVAISNFSVLLATTSPCTQKPNSGFYDCPHNVSQTDYYNGLGDYIAASCTLYPCMKAYHGSYTGGKFTEQVVHTETALPNKQETTEYTAFYNYTALRAPCILDDGFNPNTSNLVESIIDSGTWYLPNNMSDAPHLPGRTFANISLVDPWHGIVHNNSVPNACLYKMDGIYALALSYFMTDTLFSGSCYYDDMQSGHLNCGDSWWLPPLWSEMDATFDSLDAAIDDFSVAVTNKLRSTGTGPDVMLGDDPQQAVVFGLVYESSTCTYFDWRWVLFPAISVLLCGLLLAWTLVKSYRDPDQPVWKGSVLPIIFLGLHAPGTTPQRGGIDRLDDSAQAPVRGNGRSAPELDRIKDEAGRLWVRFHGGTEPGFMELSAEMKGRDAEASVASLLGASGRGKRETQQ